MKTGNNEQETPARWHFSGFVLDAGQRTLKDQEGDVIRLPARAFYILLELVRAAGRPVSKDHLLTSAWKGRIVEENSLSRAISTLRQALGDDAVSPRFIATIQGEGYQFVAQFDVDQADEPESSASKPDPAHLTAAAGKQHVQRLSRVYFALLVIVVIVAVAFIGLRSSPQAENEPKPAATGLLDLEILTDFPGSHSSPTFSPDGQWIAFTSDASGMNQVWVMSITDREPRQLTHEDNGASEPAWSPNGQQIAYNVEGWGIAMMSPLSPGPPRLLIKDGSYPEFAPSGNWLVYEYGRQVHRAQKDGSDAQRIEGIPERAFIRMQALPVVSPEDDRVAYFLADNATAGDFWHISALGGEPVRITKDGVPAAGASWIPDGKALIVSSPRNGRANLWYVPLDQSEPIPLTTGVGDDTLPVVSPDGAWVAYTHQQTQWQLVSTDPRTGESEVLLERRDSIMLPTASLDGRKAAWFSANPTRIELFTMDLEQRVANRVFNDPSRLPTAPSWSSDGQSIYYHDLASLDLRRVDIDGRNDVLAAAGFHWRRGNIWLSFQPGGDRYVFQEREQETRRFRSVARSLTGEPDVVFDAPDLRMPSWNGNGTRLVGVGPDDALWQCRLIDQQCDPLLANGEAVRGAQPQWSYDDARIYLRRYTEHPSYHSLWVFDSNDESLSQLLELGPFEANNITYDVAADDQIIWSRTLTGDSKIWRGRLP
ncbi:MAG: PD40 domain-containing protein [Gammaproteobacteria bacterium]|nr:PD40 domain-containing protein [Gammaproteobacteria bacterium]